MKSKPSADQLRAITHIRGPAMLIAGPGSGKTFTIVERISHLVSNAKIRSDNILVVTFSKAAANEMKSRYVRETGDHEVTFGTFHSVAFRILRECLRFDANSLISDAEKQDILSQVFKNHGFERILSGEYLRGILDAISKDKNLKGINGYGGIISEREEITTEDLLRIIDDYRAFLKELHKIDFDDMILLCLENLKKDPKILEKYRERFRMILVDEFQDINEPQFELIRLLALPDNDLFVVGDDDQSIYGFRGAYPGIMQRFIRDYPDAKTLYLTENYRSGRKIITFAGEVIKENRERFDKQFRPLRNDGYVRFRYLESRKEEEEFLLGELSALSDETKADTALIVRTNREALLYGAMLEKAGLAVSRRDGKRAVKSFFDSFIAEDLTAYLSYLYDGQKRSDFLLFMNKPEKYIRQSALIRETVSFEELELYYEKNQDMLRKIEKLKDQLLLAKKMPPRYALKIFRTQIGYDRYLEELGGSEAERKERENALRELTDILSGMKTGTSVREYVRNERKIRVRDAKSGKSDVSKEAENKETSDGIHVITMHASKGLEFGNVYLPDINEGVIPPKRCDSRELEEERRLLYVAITRARNELTIIATKERGRDVSRFVKRQVLKLSEK
ncbi:MAG: ATP-dependent helicase [Lachnospiraceae bacterium]|nr:ATP-dependent helicase [Lachnospiraceae bacterium]